jgi:replicative DNA helicase
LTDDDWERRYTAAMTGVEHQMEEEAAQRPRYTNVEAEAALLGAMMIDNRFIGELKEVVSPTDFYEPAHVRLMKALLKADSQGRLANPVTLRPIFEHDPDMKPLGGGGYLALLTGSGAALIGARDFARQVRDLANCRRITEAMDKALSADPDTPVDLMFSPVEAAIQAAASAVSPIRVRNAEQMLGLVQERITRVEEHGAIGASCATVPDLDEQLGRLEPGQYTILGGRPSMGKTTLALSAALGYAMNGHPVLYAHAEMTAELMALKVAADILFQRGERVPFNDILKGTLSRVHLRALDDAKEMAAALPLRFADLGKVNVSKLRTEVAKQADYWKRQGRRLEVVVVDYIGLLAADYEGRPGDDRQRVNAVSKALLKIAKDFDCHVVALAQLSRGLEQRADKRPIMSDLRDSGDLEQDADNVVFVYRHEFYLGREKPKPGPRYNAEIVDWEVDMAACRGKLDVIADKVRLGRRGTRTINWYGEFSAARGSRFSLGQDDDDLFAESSR